MLRDGAKFRDLGKDHFDKRPTQAKANRLLAQLAKLGYQADLRPLTTAVSCPPTSTAQLVSS